MKVTLSDRFKERWDEYLIYTITENEIIIENLWNTKRNPKSLKKDI
jgi:hypothetical protein